MKELKVGLIVLFVIVIGLLLTFGVRLNVMEQKTDELLRYQEINHDYLVDIKLMTDKLLERQEYDHETDLAYRTELANEEIILPDNKIDSWEELEILLTDLCKFVGYDINR